MRKHLILALLCLAAIIAIAWGNSRNFELAKTTYYPPALGHWLTVDEVHAATHEISTAITKLENWQGGYTGRQHFEYMSRFVLLEKSLAHGKPRPLDQRGVETISPRVHYDGDKWPHQCSLDSHIGLEAQLRLMIGRAIDAADRLYLLKGQPAEYHSLMGQSDIGQLAMRSDSTTDIHWEQVAWWLITTQAMSMIFSLGLFGLRMHIYGIDPWKLAAMFERTLLWMFLWPIGIWIYPSSEPAKVLVMATRRLAFILTAWFSFMPAVGLAQVKKSGDKRVTPDIVWVDQQTVTTDPPVKLTIVSLVRSKYQTRNLINAMDGPVVQTDFFVQLPRGWFVDVWTSTGLDQKANFGDEVDYGIGWSGEHVMLSLTGLELTRGGNIIQATGQVFATTSIRGHTFTPFAEVTRLQVTKDAAENSATQFWAGLLHAWGKGRISISQEASVLHETGLFGFGETTIGKFVGDLDIRLNPKFTLKVLRFTAATHEQNSGRPGFSFGSGLAVSVP